ncbi:hypothetical protein LHJ74_18060 [Streptomyces sp. N2-109]|uniref:Integral membrane protein n=1 Tax=Streptomyces gossypii TaxID=2883101 RepID=A0ABT2JV55_9ACTN|nr:hypothetical protein [Streptomyces gossypii]MCT2591778.1 hypothetical protein [Streptomyces gossypii]
MHLVMRMYVDIVVGISWAVGIGIAVRWKSSETESRFADPPAVRYAGDREFRTRSRRHSSHWI